MFKATYRDWPNRHKKLLHVTAAVMVLLLVLMWLGIYPRWRGLVSLRDDVKDMRTKLEKMGIPLDATMLNEHIHDCIASLEDHDGRKGLVSISNDIIDRATKTFDDDIREAYPPTEGASSFDLFYNNSTRIDYKDLYDRITSEFKEHDISISQKNFEPDEDSSEPVFQLMLKLWTVRYLARALVQNNLSLEKNEEGGSRIHPMRTIAYTLSPKEEPYLLEFPVILRFSGTMDNFLSFLKSLQNENIFLPMKTISVHSTPPEDFPPGEKRDIKVLHFRITCSSFYKAPSAVAPKDKGGEARQ